MKIHHTAMAVSSLEKSIQFYQNVFGLKVENTFEKKELGAKFVVMSDDNGGKIELFQFERSSTLSESQNDISVQGIKHIAFETNEVDNLWQKLKNNYECTAVEDGASARYFFIKDPTGIPVEVYQQYA